jgi:hypothetical protein
MSENHEPVVSSQLGIEAETKTVDQETEQPKRERKPRTPRVSETDELARIEGMLRGASMLTIGVASRVKQEDAIVIARHTIAPEKNAIGMNAHPNVIDAVMQLCREDKKVRAYLLGLSAQSAYLNVAVAFASMAIAVMANHNLVPPMFNPSPVNPNGTEQHGSDTMG